MQRRSGRIKARKSHKGISKVRVSKVGIASNSLITMGQSCSAQLEEAKAKNKQLENRVHLYEQGITEKSIHASQTNFGLLTIANEDNSECSCKSQSLFGFIEIIAVMMACILLLYIIYCCLVRYFTRRRAIREKRQRQLLSEVETRMGRTADGMRSNLAIEMSPPSAPCSRVHLPGYQTEHARSTGTQQDATFDH